MAAQARLFSGRVGTRSTGRPGVFPSRVCRDLELNGSLSTSPWDRKFEGQQGTLMMSSLRGFCGPLVPFQQNLLGRSLQLRQNQLKVSRLNIWLISKLLRHTEVFAVPPPEPRLSLLFCLFSFSIKKFIFCLNIYFVKQTKHNSDWSLAGGLWSPKNWLR